VVFVGGMVRGLLITDSGAAAERPTDDVDFIVRLASRMEFHRLGENLRRLGFREDSSPGAPICRWVVDGIHVDMMPTDGTILGFRNQWYPEALDHAIDTSVEGESFRIVSAPYFCATKLDAFADRGGGDMYHHDIEDVIAVIDGRAELHEELVGAEEDVRTYVGREITKLLATSAFMEALPGHLPGDRAGQARLSLVEARLRAIASLPTTHSDR
jgi:predicted nucleotidyltransferase